MPVTFSLNRLLSENPGLAKQFLWTTNPDLSDRDPRWLQLGCGSRVFDGFVNLDIAPQHHAVVRWNLLDPWPFNLEKTSDGAFSEDCLEHFFHSEQTYILCNLNRALKTNAVARILMPNLRNLIAVAKEPLSPADFIRTTFGVETAADAINFVMRFTAHRWFHDDVSFTRMADLCGFEATSTNCSDSTVPFLSGRNLRGEADLLSFANDLRKTRHLHRRLISPASVEGAIEVERVGEDAVLFLATKVRPTVNYALPNPLTSGKIICLNVRSSNLSSTDWNVKYLRFIDINEDKPWGFDDSMKSAPSLNIITAGQIRLIAGEDSEISRIAFTPSYQPGEYFTTGPVEIFLVE